VRRYDIYFARFDPVEGSELAKTRPAVIVSLDVLNKKLATVVVCPLTTQLQPQWRTRLQIRCAGRPAEIAVDQIRALSKSGLTRKVDQLSAEDAEALRRLIAEMYCTG
jgi:mRNA interferase MazF